MMGRVRGKFLWAALAGLAFLATTGAPARAGYNAVLVGGTPTYDAVANNYIYTYSVTTTAPNEQISTGDYFRFYDFNGYVAGSASGSAGWTPVVQNFNGNPPSVILTHGDDAAVANITFTYSGSPITTGNLGNFVLRSQYGLGGSFKDFYGLSTNTGTNPNTGIDTRLDYLAPVPEPTSFLSAGLGIVGLGLGLGFRNRSKRAS